MKKMIYILLLSLLSTAAMANGLSDLRITVHGHTLFTVSINGMHYSYPDYRFEIRDLIPGRHYLEVYRHGGYYGHAILFAGYIQLAPASVIHARIDRFGRFVVQKIIPKYVAPVVYQPAPVYAPAFYPMSDYDFGLLRESIRSKSFESSRLQVAKQALATRFLSSFQVRELMEMMWFESTRLELAKYAFSRVIDRERFYLVNDAFSFESSIRELDDFIRQHG